MSVDREDFSSVEDEKRIARRSFLKSVAYAGGIAALGLIVATPEIASARICSCDKSCSGSCGGDCTGSCSGCCMGGSGSSSQCSVEGCG